MALYLRQNFVSAQYLENQLVEFSTNYIYAFILARSNWNCYTSFFKNLYQSYVPFLRQNFVSAQHLEYQLVEFHQILCMHSSWLDQAWASYTSFSEICTRRYVPVFTPILCFRSIS